MKQLTLLLAISLSTAVGAAVGRLAAGIRLPQLIRG